MPGPKPFPDHRDRLFGRAGDLVRLRERVKHKGVTFVTGRPKMGKTWTLLELARGLEAEGGFTVGYAAGFPGFPDLPLRAIADAYERWYPSTDWREPAAALLAHHHDDLLPETVAFFERLLAGAAEGPMGVTGALLDALAEEWRGHLSGGFHQRRLPVEMAQDLVGFLAAHTGRPVVLLLDAWEQTPELEVEAEFLDIVLAEPQDWPEGQVHFVVGIAPGTSRARAGELAAQLTARHRAAQNLALETASLGAAPALSLRDGETHFLGDEELRFLLRLALLPPLETPWFAARLTPLLADGGDPAALTAALETKGLLRRETRGGLSFEPPPGHEATRGPLFATFPAQATREAEALTVALATGADGASVESVPFCVALGALAVTSRDLPVAGPYRALQAAAGTVLYGRPLSADERQTFLDALPAVRELAPGAGPFLARVLFNTLHHLQTNAKRSSTLAPWLAHLRQLALQPAADEAVRRHLAMWLFNAVDYAHGARDVRERNARFDELRQLARLSPAARPTFARGLVNAMLYLGKPEEALSELRELAENTPEEPEVLHLFAKGLFFAQIDAVKARDLAGRDQRLDELRELARCAPGDAHLHLWLAKSFLNARLQLQRAGEHDKASALGAQHWQIHRAFPQLSAPLAEELGVTVEQYFATFFAHPAAN